MTLLNYPSVKKTPFGNSIRRRVSQQIEPHTLRYERSHLKLMQPIIFDTDPIIEIQTNDNLTNKLAAHLPNEY